MAKSGPLWSVLLTAGLLLGCASEAPPARDADYLRWVSFPVRLNENVLLRWHERDMPLRVFLPPPPDGLFERQEAEAIYDSVRDGVLDWSDVAKPGVPSFVFVDEAGDADIPIVWAAEPDGNWYVAHCAYDASFATHFGVERILVTARWGDGRVADLHDLYATMLHETGHALGLGGHSPYPEDIMFEYVAREAAPGLSPRDRNTLARLYARPIGTRIVGAKRR